jgi:predicted DNA-binding transcriptional regulator AlpA
MWMMIQRRLRSNITMKAKTEELITVKEAAEILGLKEKTVYNGRGGTAALARVKQGRNVSLIKRQVLEHKQQKIAEAIRIAEKVAYGN